MPGRTHSILSIRLHLYALAGVVALALVSMLGFTLYSDYHSAVLQEKRRIVTLAQLMADGAAQTLEANHKHLERIAARPLIRAMDGARCDPILVDFRDLFTEFANFATADLTGHTICSGLSKPGGKPVSVARLDWYQRGVAEKRFLVGRPYLGQISRRMVAVLVEPVWGEERSLRGLLALPLDLERFNPRIPAASLPDGTRFGFMAADGTLVWRNVDPEDLIGKHIGDHLAPKRALQVRDGDFESVGTDGVARYYAVASVAPVGWVAFIGVPTPAIAEKVFEAAARNAVIGLLSLVAIGVILAFLLRRIQHAEADLLAAKDAAEAANRAKSVFLSNMSHELRTPLNAILGFADLMERDTSLPEPQRRNLATINRSGRHLLSLINDILEISRIEAGRLVVQPQPCDLRELVETVVESLELRARSSGLELTLHMADDLPGFVTTDPVKLRQMLINLLSNAIKYTPRGRVDLAATAAPPDADGRTLLSFIVSDTGVGIAADELERVFQPFYQTEHGVRVGEGTGLGLNIARQYAQLLGGSLTASSVPGKGSQFELRLPAASAEPVSTAPARRRVVGLAPGQPSHRILIVEDRLDSRRLLTQLMEGAGFTVELAADGEEAVEAFRRHRPDFVWMDMRMPVMDGYEATRRIRALPEGMDVPIVALTASAFDEDRAAILAAGCSDMLRKPIDADQLFDVLARRLGVEFVFADSGETPPAGGVPAEVADFSVLPADVRRRLYHAAVRLDVGAVHAIADELATERPELARDIRNAAGEFRFDGLIAATDDPADGG